MDSDREAQRHYAGSFGRWNNVLSTRGIWAKGMERPGVSVVNCP